MSQEQKAELTREELVARLATLEKQLANKPASGGIKISEKGGVSVYGLGRFPVTLYESQWRKLIEMTPAIATFIDANMDKLAKKE